MDRGHTGGELVVPSLDQGLLRVQAPVNPQPERIIHKSLRSQLPRNATKRRAGLDRKQSRLVKENRGLKCFQTLPEPETTASNRQNSKSNNTYE